MSVTYQRRYRGKIQAVLLDWAGTTMDYGSMASAVVFVEVYRRQGVPITMDEARASTSINLHGHEAGNGGHSQGEPRELCASPRPY